MVIINTFLGVGVVVVCDVRRKDWEQVDIDSWAGGCRERLFRQLLMFLLVLDQRFCRLLCAFIDCCKSPLLAIAC
jgi:hypothetical protein